jgi:hypothetical protein
MSDNMSVIVACLTHATGLDRRIESAIDGRPQLDVGGGVGAGNLEGETFRPGTHDCIVLT